MKTRFFQKEFILLSVALSATLVIARVSFAQTPLYLFLLWNLFLAWIPYQLSKVIVARKHTSGIFVWLLALSWLLFLPNSAYIITDLFHLRHRPPVPLWFDTVLFFWVAWNGLVLGVLSLINMERFMAARLNGLQLRLWLYVIFLLCAFGIYAGRFLRWNSWYVLTKPERLIRDCLFLFTHPQAGLRMAGVTLLFSALLMSCYFTIKSMAAQAIKK